jgi:hypothetical protein
VFTLLPTSEAPPAPVEDRTLKQAPEEVPSPTTRKELHHGLSIPLDVRVIRWLPPLALLAIFFLLWFPWVGLYPGGESVYTQLGWQVMFGGTPEPDKDFFKPLTGLEKSDLEVGVSWPLLLYLLVWLPTLLLAIATAAVGVLPLKLPPPVQQALSWKAAVLAALALLAFLLLLLKTAVSFPLETKVVERAEEKVKDDRPKSAADAKYTDPLVQQKLAAWGLRTTGWYRLAVWCNVAAIFFLLVELWLTRRGEGRRPPRLEIGWSDG